MGVPTTLVVIEPSHVSRPRAEGSPRHALPTPPINPHTTGSRVATQFLSQFPLPRTVTAAIAQRRGADTERCVKEDPFFEVLTAYPAARFADVERLASMLRADRRSPMRVALALLHCLRYAASQGGHTFLPWLQLQATTRSFLAQTGALLLMMMLVLVQCSLVPQCLFMCPALPMLHSIVVSVVPVVSLGLKPFRSTPHKDLVA